MCEGGSSSGGGVVVVDMGSMHAWEQASLPCVAALSPPRPPHLEPTPVLRHNGEWDSGSEGEVAIVV